MLLQTPHDWTIDVVEATTIEGRHFPSHRALSSSGLFYYSGSLATDGDGWDLRMTEVTPNWAHREDRWAESQEKEMSVRQI